MSVAVAQACAKVARNSGGARALLRSFSSRPDAKGSKQSGVGGKVDAHVKTKNTHTHKHDLGNIRGRPETEGPAHAHAVTQHKNKYRPILFLMPCSEPCSGSVPVRVAKRGCLGRYVDTLRWHDKCE
eukprot:366070-Chlamydomonas_euryale.AAC.12